MGKKIRALEDQIRKIKLQMDSLGDLRPGSLSRQYNVCGSPKCRCKEAPPKKHGPYYQLSFTRKGRSSSKFIKKQHLQDIRKQIKNYSHLRALLDRWIELGTQLSDLRLDQQNSR